MSLYISYLMSVFGNQIKSIVCDMSIPCLYVIHIFAYLDIYLCNLLFNVAMILAKKFKGQSIKSGLEAPEKGLQGYLEEIDDPIAQFI